MFVLAALGLLTTISSTYDEHGTRAYAVVVRPEHQPIRGVRVPWRVVREGRPRCSSEATFGASALFLRSRASTPSPKHIRAASTQQPESRTYTLAPSPRGRMGCSAGISRPVTDVARAVNPP